MAEKQIKPHYCKLNECEVRMIRIFWRDYPHVSINMMAKRFKVNRETISLVVKGKTWPHLPVHKPHVERLLNIRGYGDTNEKRNRNYDRDKYPRGSVLAGGKK